MTFALKLYFHKSHLQHFLSFSLGVVNKFKSTSARADKEWRGVSESLFSLNTRRAGQAEQEVRAQIERARSVAAITQLEDDEVS